MCVPNKFSYLHNLLIVNGSVMLYAATVCHIQLAGTYTSDQLTASDGRVEKLFDDIVWNCRETGQSSVSGWKERE